MSNISNKVIHSSVFNKLKQEFVEIIEFICVFGENANEVIFITNTDKAFAFGSNEYGCLGFGHNYAVEEPKQMIHLSGKQVVDIRYGAGHVIALTKSGSCYSWGRNDWGNNLGQIGIGYTENPNIPIIINSEMRFKEIASNPFSDLSIGLSETHKCYVWVECDIGVITTPKETQFKSINETFAVYSKMKTTLHLIRF
jgi:alpha-tubulin suppressor-like RCC1 family protein